MSGDRYAPPTGSLGWALRDDEWAMRDLRSHLVLDKSSDNLNFGASPSLVNSDNAVSLRGGPPGSSIMLARIALVAALLPPGVARAQFSLAVTQIGGKYENDGQAHTGTCAKDACRAILPVQIGGDGGDVCVLSVRVGAPTVAGSGRILFAAGPCRSGRKLAISGYPAATDYVLNQFGAASLSFVVPFQSAKWAMPSNDWDDAVVHEAATVRLDIVATNVR